MEMRIAPEIAAKHLELSPRLSFSSEPPSPRADLASGATQESQSFVDPAAPFVGQLESTDQDVAGSPLTSVTEVPNRERSMSPEPAAPHAEPDLDPETSSELNLAGVCDDVAESSGALRRSVSLERATVQYDYSPGDETSDHVAVYSGEVVVVELTADEWWYVRVVRASAGGVARGWIPAAYATPLEEVATLAAVTRDPVLEAAAAKSVRGAGVVYRARKRLIVRASFHKNSAKVGELGLGDEITALGSLANAEGQLRVRFEGGWVSLTAQSGAALLEQIGGPEADLEAVEIAVVGKGEDASAGASEGAGGVGTRYVCVRTSVVQRGFGMESERLGTLAKGTIVRCLERRHEQAGGVVRVRFKLEDEEPAPGFEFGSEGWTSETTSDGRTALQEEAAAADEETVETVETVQSLELHPKLGGIAVAAGPEIAAQQAASLSMQESEQPPSLAAFAFASAKAREYEAMEAAAEVAASNAAAAAREAAAESAMLAAEEIVASEARAKFAEAEVVARAAEQAQLQVEAEHKSKKERKAAAKAAKAAEEARLRAEKASKQEASRLEAERLAAAVAMQKQARAEAEAVDAARLAAEQEAKMVAAEEAAMVAREEACGGNNTAPEMDRSSSDDSGDDQNYAHGLDGENADVDTWLGSGSDTDTDEEVERAAQRAAARTASARHSDVARRISTDNEEVLLTITHGGLLCAKTRVRKGGRLCYAPLVQCNHVLASYDAAASRSIFDELATEFASLSEAAAIHLLLSAAGSPRAPRSKDFSSGRQLGSLPPPRSPRSPQSPVE
eukprot:SAG11_NODE_517_length_8815_cov_35.866797_3_plen_792_part_00